MVSSVGLELGFEFWTRVRLNRHQLKMLIKCEDGLPQWFSGKESTCNAGDVRDRVQSKSREDSLKEGMATHSSILARKIPWTKNASELWSVESQSPTGLEQLSRACTHWRKEPRETVKRKKGDQEMEGERKVRRSRERVVWNQRLVRRQCL